VEVKEKPTFKMYRMPTGLVGWIVAWAYTTLVLVLRLVFRKAVRKFDELIDLQPEDDLLDVACGTGWFLKKNAAHVHHIAGIDLHEIGISMARRRNRKRIAAGTAEIVLGDSAALPWEDNRFSAVTCNCLQCFAEPQKSVQEMHRVLRPGGRVLISAPYDPDEVKARKNEQKWGCHCWTEAELRKMIDNAGLSHVFIERMWAHKGALAIKAAKQ
jgi:ubiquinone/menaquinone biosynthesis C-methylase UbiE